MKSLISERFAAHSLITILSVVILFHLLVLLQIIPFSIVWGGRITDSSQMVVFEVVSIVLNLVMLTVISVKAGILKLNLRPLFMRIALSIMCGVFLLNTVGNFVSKNEFEKLVFTPLTLILSLLCLRLLLPGNKEKYQ